MVVVGLAALRTIFWNVLGDPGREIEEAKLWVFQLLDSSSGFLLGDLGRKIEEAELSVFQLFDFCSGMLLGDPGRKIEEAKV